MTIGSLIDTPSELTDSSSSKSAIVLMTRIRLARNLAGDPADSATADSATAGYVLVNGARHAMLRHHRRFTGLAADFAVATLLGRKVQGPVAQILAGQRWIEI